MFNNQCKPLFIVSIFFSIALLSGRAWALYDVNNTGVSDVYGLSGDAVRPAIGSEFGTVRAITETNNAYALFGNGGDIEIRGDLPSGGIIYAKAGNDSAYGIYGEINNSITTGNINGTIIAEADSDFACGLRSFKGSITTGDINGIITATAGASKAYGMFGNDSSIITGDINGTITATANDHYAYGLVAYDSLTIGNINGTIIATAGQISAQGLSAYDSLTIGDINGNIVATAGNDFAIGLHGSAGSMTTGSITTGAIRGTINAHAGGDFAYGILAYGPMYINVDGGTISAIADNGLNVAAIQSGKINFNILEIHNADDRVEIVAGSTIIGDIDLGMNGTDNDVLTLSGVNTKSTTLNDDLKNIETINITGGRWNINGTVSNSTNGINMTGGILGGTGTLNSLNVIGGTLAPGNSIGTTNINGNLTLDSSSTLEIEVDNSGNSDKLVVTGNANINGGTLKPISTETITKSQEYTIIEAQKVSGRFDVVDTALLDTTISNVVIGPDYLDNSVLLKIFPRRFDSSEIFATDNQRSLGSALQQIADSGGNDITTELQHLTNVTDLRNAYNQLSGQTTAGLAPITLANNTRFTNTVTNRLRNTHNGLSYGLNDSTALLAMARQDNIPVSAGLSDTQSVNDSFALGNGTPYFSNQNWGFWGRGYTVFGDREAQAGMTGYQYTTFGTGFGLDYKFTDELTVGATGGYADGSVNYFSSQDKSDVHSIPLGIYGSWNTDSYYLDSILSYTPTEYKTHRYIDLTSERLTGEFDGYDISEYLEAGYNLYRSERYLVQPLASLQVSYLNIDSYSESGGNSALSYDKQSYESYKGSLGVKVIRQLGKETQEQSSAIELRGRWTHELGDTKSNVNANFADQPAAIFAISDEGLPRDSFILGAGFRARLKETTTIYIDYDTSLNSEDTAHVISAGLQYRW
jgi:uncharacterized protein with beta-barrel porin domain